MKNIFPARRVKQFGSSDEGQALVLTAMGLLVLLLMAGLGVDVGYLRYQKQQMQKAADAAALAGASAKIYGSDYVTAGQNDSKANGFQNGLNGIQVNVVSPPTTGPFSTAADKDNYVQATVSQLQPTFFMRVGGFNNVNVAATSVASTAGSASGCIYVMDPLASSSYKVAGTANVNATCGIQVDSSSSSAYNDTGGGCTTAASIGIVGGVKSGTCSHPTPVTGVSTFSDPLSALAEPQPTSCTLQSGNINGGTVTLKPDNNGIATFCGGINIHGTSPNVTFQPGLYIMYGGGMQINSSAIVAGNGVTFYNTGTKSGPTGFQPITINGGSGITLSAPTSGTYAGILFFENREIAKNGNINNTITGLAGSTFNGTLYFLNSNLNYEGNSTNNGYTIIIADTLSVLGTSVLGDNYTSLPGGISPIHSSVLVE